MKILIILAVILGVLFLYFAVNAEKAFIVKNDEVSLGGIDVPKTLLNAVQGIGSRIAGGNFKLPGDNAIGNLLPGFSNNIVSDSKDFISNATDKIGEAITKPIENKIQEIICPAK